MRILAYISGFDGCGLFRLQLPFKYLNKKPGITAKISFVYAKEEIQWADLIIVQKQYQESVIPYVKMAQDMKKPVVLEFDDLMTDIPDWNVASKFYSNKKEQVINFVKLCNACTVSTSYLRSVHSGINGNIHVLPNSMDVAQFDEFKEMPQDELFKYTQFKNPRFLNTKDVQPTLPKDDVLAKLKGRLKIMWWGSPTHEADLNIIDKTLAKLCSEFPELLIVKVGCCTSTFLDYMERYLDQLVVVNPIQVHNFHRALYSVASTGPTIALSPIVDLPFNRAKCVSGDTRIVTDKGICTISDVVIHRANNQMIMGDLGKIYTGKEYETMSASFYARRQNIKIIQTSNGYKIKGPKDHRVMTSKGWVELKNLNLMDKIEISPFEYPTVPYKEIVYPYVASKNFQGLIGKPEMLPKIKINERWGRLFGYLMGDGCVRGISSVGVSCSTEYPDIIEDVVSLLNDVGLHTFLSPKKDKRKKEAGKGVDVLTSSKHFVDWCRNDLKIIGKKEQGKIFKIPNFIWASPKSVIREFLRGLIESDGDPKAECCGVRYCTKSEQLAYDVQFALLGFGIKSSVRRRYITLPVSKIVKPYYYVFLLSKSARIFQQEIGFISKHKMQRLTELCQREKSNAYKDWDWFDDVTSCEDDVTDVFDVTVNNAHCYNGNGFVNHNSNLKVIESFMIGATAVASKVENYAKTVTHNVNGLLADNTVGKDGIALDWYEKLKTLITDPIQTQFLADNGLSTVKSHYNVEKNADLWLAAYQDILSKGVIR